LTSSLRAESRSRRRIRIVVNMKRVHEVASTAEAVSTYYRANTLDVAESRVLVKGARAAELADALRVVATEVIAIANGSRRETR